MPWAISLPSRLALLGVAAALALSLLLHSPSLAHDILHGLLHAPAGARGHECAVLCCFGHSALKAIYCIDHSSHEVLNCYDHSTQVENILREAKLFSPQWLTSVGLAVVPTQQIIDAPLHNSYF